MAAVAAAGGTIAACAPKSPEVEPTQAPAQEATQAPTEAPTEAPTAVPAKEVNLTFYAQSYTPTRVLMNPDPNAPQVTAMDTVVNAWMDMHPGVTLELINAPTGDYHDWIVTQLIGGTGPDIFWRWLGTLNDHADKGQVVILNDYLELPNKYTPDDPRPWKEHFKSPFQTRFSPKGNWGGVPLDLVSTGLYLNVDMLKEAGVDMEEWIDPELGSPKSWASFMEGLKQVQDAGYMACHPGPGVTDQWWIYGVLTDQLMWEWRETMDTLNYHELRPMEFQETMISQEEINQRFWCEDWNPFEEETTREEFRIVKEWSSTFPEGWTTETIIPKDLFLMGELCCYWDGTWQVGSIMQDDRREFEFTSTWLPPVTKETTPVVADPPNLPIGVGGYGSITYGINHKVEDEGNVDLCVDFLMYVTTPENDELIVNEVPKFIPSHKDAKALPEVENMFVGETRLVAGAGHPVQNPVGWFGGQEIRWGDTIFRELTLYYLDEQDLDTTMENLYRHGSDNAEELLRQAAVQYSEDGNWDLEKWSCQPEI
jgi:ABC-type glycerol-3-phosphate transport system substrate-binding protein